MLRQNLLLTALLGLLLPCCFAQEAQPAYRNPNLTPQERAADLVKRMTLEEKVDQLAGGRRRARAASENPEEKQAFEALVKLYREDSQVSAHDAAEARNKAQHYLVEKTRAGHSGNFSGRSLARIHGLRQHQLSAGAGSGQHMGSRTRAAGVHGCCGRNGLRGRQSGFHSGAGFVTRPALGTDRKKPMAKIRIWSRAWAWPRSTVCKALPG